MKTSITAMILAAGLLGVAFAPTAKADAWNQKTIVTFNAPVEVPGHVLSPGTYVLKMADPSDFPGVVQIFNASQTKLVTTFMTAPDYRDTPTDQTAILFAERPANAPPAVHAWFYPGMQYGHEFLYRNERP